jgi:hypothetical protein
MSAKNKSAIAFSRSALLPRGDAKGERSSASLSQRILMTYKDKLNPWCIIRPVSNVQMRIVGRFCRRVDAEGHIRILKQLMPTVPFEIMFDIASEDTEEGDKTPSVST